MTSTASSQPLTREQAYALVDAISEIEDMALAVSAFEDANGEWVFEATCETAPDLESFSEIARQTLGGTVSFSAAEIDPDIDWVARSQEGLAPVLAGGFFIHGSHDAGNVPASARPILIDAAQAFGTGHHETTTGCLIAIEQVLKTARPKNVLDLGTGTGVLAIALAKRLHRKILATDIDPVAVRVTRENAALNGVARYVEALTAPGLDHLKIRRRAPFDMIVANILAGPLAQLAPAISASAVSGAPIILSGILRRQASRVIAAYNQQDVILKRRLNRGDWATLILEKA